MDYFYNADQQSMWQGQENLVPTDKGNNVFGAYTNAAFLNAQKVINSTNFFTFAPAPLMTYYWSIVRRNLEWYNGYVWGIHNRGILSTQTASRICKMAADLTISGGFYFEGTPRAEQFLTKFAHKTRLGEKLKQKLPVLNAIGFMLAKLDFAPDGEVSIDFVPGNRYFAMTDDNKQVLAYYALIKVLTDGVGNEGEEDIGYYLVEQRYMRGGKARQKYRIYKGPMVATSPVFGGETNTTIGIPYEHLPRNVQQYITQRFGADVLEREYTLPLDCIGAEIVLNSYAATGMDDYTCFADSTLQNAHMQLYMLDWTETLKGEHKYIAQDFVAMPDTMTGFIAGSYSGDQARAVAAEINSVEGFNKRLVKASRMRDPEKALPVIYQAQLRLDEYNRDINQILSEIAANTQFSPITIAGHLRNGAEKTATEVTADENATRLTIENKRTLIAESLNRLFALVLRHYGLNDSGNMIFKAGSLSNPQLELNLIKTKLESGLLDRLSAIMQANPQFTPREAEETYNKIMREGGALYRGDSRGIDDIL
jgi:hypothetical protein